MLLFNQSYLWVVRSCLSINLNRNVPIRSNCLHYAGTLIKLSHLDLKYSNSMWWITFLLNNNNNNNNNNVFLKFVVSARPPIFSYLVVRPFTAFVIFVHLTKHQQWKCRHAFIVNQENILSCFSGFELK